MISAALRPLKSRLGRNLAAQGYSQVAMLGVQLATIPLLIRAWGVEHYGVWLTLTAIPSYLAFSDFGFTFIAKNDMSARAARGDHAGALETYQSVFLLLVCIFPALLAAVCAAAAATPIGHILNIADVSDRDAKLVICVQAFGILVLQIFYLLCAKVRAVGRPATETAFAANARVLEALCLVGTACAGGGLLAAAAAAVGARLTITIVLAFWARRAAPWLTLGAGSATRARLRQLVAPSLSYMLVPVANAILIQGPVVALGAFGTPTAVALFSTTRTATRIGMSGANMLSNGFVAEYSYAWGSGDKRRFLQLLKQHSLLLLAGGITYVAAISTLGGFGVRLLSHGRMWPNEALLAALGCAVAMEMVWTSAYAPLTSTVSHKSTSAFFALAALATGIVLPLTPGAVALACTIAIAHLATCFFSVARLRQLLNGFPSQRGAAANVKGARQLRIAVVGTHQMARQRSMKLYSEWLVDACSPLGQVDLITPPAFFLNRYTSNWPGSKWLLYLDQFVLLQSKLISIQFFVDAIVVADHSNTPCSLMITRCPLIAMVHDTIAIRKALGLIDGQVAASVTGRVLQRLIIRALQRCRLLLTNPAPVPHELAELGIYTDVVPVGCPFDEGRLRAGTRDAIPVELRGRRYLLNVGSDAVRKRKPDLLKLWAHFEGSNDDCWLVLAGHTNQSTVALARTLGIRRMMVIDDVCDDQLGALYAQSEGIVVASEFEGFCIPVLEAIAFSKRVFTPVDVDFFATVFGECVKPCLDIRQADSKGLVDAMRETTPRAFDHCRAQLLERYSVANFGFNIRDAVLTAVGHDPVEPCLGALQCA